MIAATAVVLAACGGQVVTDQPAADAPSTGTETSVTEPFTSSVDGSFPDGPGALRTPDDPAFPSPLVDLTQVLTVIPPDSIPAIDNPQFVSVADADQYLESDEAVVVLELEGQARAYPVQILMWHEIVNDEVGGTPVAITYCPLCNSAVTYERRIGGLATTFGTSGKLFNSALVMYDRATESLWTHYDGRAVAGLLTGERLTPIPSPLLAWDDFKAAHPDGLVLDRDDTGHRRSYGVNPYTGYDDPTGRTLFPFSSTDERAETKQRVVGIAIGDESRAYALAALSQGEATATNDELAGTPLVVFWKAGQASALDVGGIADGRDVGSVAVFNAEVEGSILTFNTQGPAFVDDQTGSTWDITGTALTGSMAGSSLARIHHLDTFWFAWSSYMTGSDLVEAIP